MNRKLFIFVVFLLVLSGCKKDNEIVKPYKLTKQIIDTMSSSNEQGIYMIESSKNQLIIYRGVEKAIKTMSYSINDNVLTIFFNTEESNQSKDYVYKITSNASFDTILLSVDGKNEAFNTIFSIE